MFSDMVFPVLPEVGCLLSGGTSPCKQRRVRIWVRSEVPLLRRF